MDQVRRFERELLEYMRTRHAELLETVRVKGELPGGDALRQAVESFKATFVAEGPRGDGKGRSQG